MFGIALRRVYVSNPTGGVMETQIHTIDFSIYLGCTEKIEYKSMHDMPRER